MNTDILFTLYRRPETVFTVNTITQLFPDVSYKSIRDRLRYFANVGKLHRIRHGVYAKTPFHPFELANKLYTPSYISLETVLEKEGVVFQHYKTIFAVSYLTRTLTIQDITIQYRQIRHNVLINTEGIEKHAAYYIASRERAFLDAVYIYKNYHFDNLGILDWNKIQTLKTLYNNRTFEKRVAEYETLNKEAYGKH